MDTGSDFPYEKGRIRAERLTLFRTQKTISIMLVLINAVIVHTNTGRVYITVQLYEGL